MPTMPSMPGSRSTSHKLRRSDGGGNAGILTMVLVIISLAVFTMSAREGGQGFFSSVQGVAQTLVSPLRVAGAGIVSPFTGLGNVFRNLTADEKTLMELKAENERLAARNVELEEAAVTVKQLQALLELKSSYELQATAARVIAGSTDSWTSTITIDKGTAAGLAVGMPVVDEFGAIGQLISCSATTSTARLLSDEGSSVSAMIQSSRAQGMLKGSPDGTLYLSFIRTDVTVDVGDIVVTGGLGGVFPKGLPMGKVASIESSPGSTYYTIVVEPFSTVSNFEEVMVITSLTEGQEATAEDIEQADAADLTAASGQSVATGEDEKDDEGEEGNGGESTGDGANTGIEQSDTSTSARTTTSQTTDASHDDEGQESGENTGFVSPHTV